MNLQDVDFYTVGQRVSDKAITVCPFLHLHQLISRDGETVVKAHFGLKVNAGNRHLTPSVFTEVRHSVVLKTEYWPLGFGTTATNSDGCKESEIRELVRRESNSSHRQ